MNKFEVELDSEAEGYHPFILIGIFGFIGMVLIFVRFSHGPINPTFLQIYWWMFLLAGIVDIVLYQFVFPEEKMEIEMDPKGNLCFHYRKDSIAISKKVQLRAYWWNYKFAPGLNYSTEIDWTHDKDGLSGNGPANELWRYIELVDESEDSMILYEEMQVWESTPHWPYSVRTKDSGAEKFRCLNLSATLKNLEGLVHHHRTS